MYMKLSDDEDASAALTTGFVLGRSLEIFGRGFWRFILLGTIAVLPMFILSFTAGIMLGLSHADKTTIAVVGVLVALLSLITFSLFAKLCVFHGAFQLMRGERFTMGESFYSAIGSFAPAWAAYICIIAISALGYVLLIIPGVIFGIMASVAIPICMVEKPGILESIRQSRDLTEDFRWQIFVVSWANGIFFLIIKMIGSLLLGGDIIKSDLLKSPYLFLFNVVWYSILTSFSAILIAVVYQNLRAIKNASGEAEVADTVA